MKYKCSSSDYQASSHSNVKQYERSNYEGKNTPALGASIRQHDQVLLNNMKPLSMMVSSIVVTSVIIKQVHHLL